MPAGPRAAASRTARTSAASWGLAWAWWAGRREIVRPPDEYRRVGGRAPASPGASVAGLVAGGRFRDAAPAYFRLAAEQARRLLPPEDSLAFGNWLFENRHPQAALVVYQRHLRDYPAGELAAEAHLGAGLVQLHELGQPTAAYQHLVEVFDFDPDPRTAAHARQALAAIADRQKFRVRRLP